MMLRKLNAAIRKMPSAPRLHFQTPLGAIKVELIKGTLLEALQPFKGEDTDVETGMMLDTHGFLVHDPDGHVKKALEYPPVPDDDDDLVLPVKRDDFGNRKVARKAPAIDDDDLIPLLRTRKPTSVRDDDDDDDLILPRRK